MKLHKVNNKRNERLFKRLTESCGCTVAEETIDEGPFDAVIAEESRDDTAIVNLLSQISQKLDGLEDIDTSIDYLIGALSGETALSAKMKQSTLGRFADASPQLAELLKAKGLLE